MGSGWSALMVGYKSMVVVGGLDGQRDAGIGCGWDSWAGGRSRNG